MKPNAGRRLPGRKNGAVSSRTYKARDPQTYARGDSHPRAKMTYQKAQAIRADHRSSATLAREYGISQTLVCEIRKGRRWMNPHPVTEDPSA